MFYLIELLKLKTHIFSAILSVTTIPRGLLVSWTGVAIGKAVLLSFALSSSLIAICYFCFSSAIIPFAIRKLAAEDTKNHSALSVRMPVER